MSGKGEVVREEQAERANGTAGDWKKREKNVGIGGSCGRRQRRVKNVRENIFSVLGWRIGLTPIRRVLFVCDFYETCVIAMRIKFLPRNKYPKIDIWLLKFPHPHLSSFLSPANSIC
jgi:hypothetical protein